MGDQATPKSRMILAALDLLRQSGLSGAGINQVIAASAAPKGSLYHYFPGGKTELTITALKEAERGVGQRLREVFHTAAPLATKVTSLFAGAATGLEATAFTRGCPVAAVTLDLDGDSAELRAACRAVFESWRQTIAAGLDDVPDAERRAIALLILATFEGGLMLARAEASEEPLLSAGRGLGDVLALRFGKRAAPRRPQGRRRRG